MVKVADLEVFQVFAAIVKEISRFPVPFVLLIFNQLELELIYQLVLDIT